MSSIYLLEDIPPNDIDLQTFLKQKILRSAIGILVGLLHLSFNQLATHRGSRIARDTQFLTARVEPSLRLWELLGLGEMIQGV